MKGFRVVVLIAAIALTKLVVQGIAMPAHAAAQVASPGAETTQKGTPPPADKPGAQSYAKHCAICHGDEREGILPAFPPLLGIRRQMTNDKIVEIVHSGKGRMPGFPALNDGELDALLHFLTTAEAPAANAGTTGGAAAHESGLEAAGDALFHQNCAFCHGRDAMGGETGPDLTRSKLVLADKSGEEISKVVREGRPDNKMPAFNFSSQELLSLVAFIREREKTASSSKGSRRGVDISDLQTGNVKAGMEYFNGAGGCAKCHSPTGDLKGIATRFEGLQLEERMLYPRGAKSTVTVTLPSGAKVSGTLAYRDEFTVALRDAQGTYRSWSTSRVRFTVNSPADAHVEQFGKYSDDDIHNLMAYLQTLR